MNLSSKQTIVGCVIALGLGATLAAILPKQSTASIGATRQAPANPAAPALPQGRPVSAALQESIQKGSGADRWLQLLSTLENARAEDMPGLVRIAGNDSSMVRMLAARWAELDPDHMFRSLYAEFLQPEGAPGTLPSRSTLSDVLFEEWTKSDPRAAIKALTDVPDFAGRQNLRMTACNRVMQVDVEAGLQVLKDWNVEHYVPDMKKVAEWAGRDPQHAADVVAALGGNYAALEALKQVGKAWATRDPAAGLQFAASLSGPQRAALGGEIISAWAARDVKAAAAFVSAEADLNLRGAIARGLVTTWGKTDPAAALAWSQENLRGMSRVEAIGGLIKAAAEKDLTSAADLVAGMDPGPAQSQACASIFEAWFKKGTDQRESAFAWLDGLGDGEAQKAALERVQWDWVWRDPAGVKNFISGPQGHLASSSLIMQAARSEAAKNPESAMQWAASLPAGQAHQARQAVFENWLNVRPAGAAEYARNLPAGPEREAAIRTVTQMLAYQSPKEAADWFRKLSGDDRTIAQEIFDRTGLSPDKRKELNEALKAP